MCGPSFHRETRQYVAFLFILPFIGSGWGRELGGGTCRVVDLASFPYANKLEKVTSDFNIIINNNNLNQILERSSMCGNRLPLQTKMANSLHSCFSRTREELTLIIISKMLSFHCKAPVS